MSRRFRPFYVAAAAVVMVGLFGTKVVPRSQEASAPQTVSVQSIAQADEGSEWLGPLENPTPSLLNLTGSLSLSPFNLGQ